MINIDSESERREAAKGCLKRLAATFGREVPLEVVESYWLVLGQLPVERMQRAVEKAIREEKWLPTPATIRDHARSLPNADGASRNFGMLPPIAASPAASSQMTPEERLEIDDLGAMYRARWAARAQGLELSVDELADVIAARSTGTRARALAIAQEAVTTCDSQESPTLRQQWARRLREVSP